MREEWKVKIFDEVISHSQIGIVRNNKAQSPENAFRYFKMSNIRNDNGINEDSFTYVNASDEEVEKYKLVNNDFLFNTRNSFELVGKTCVYISKYTKPTLFNNNILRVRFKPELIPQFVTYLFCTPTTLFELEKIKSGTTNVIGIYYKSLKNIPIPIPPIEEQKQIVAVLDQAFTAIDQAKTNIEKNIVNAKEFQISATNDLFNSIRNSELLTIDDITDFITDYVANGSFASLKENVNYKREKDYAVLLRLTDHSKKFKNDFVYVDKHSFDFLKKSTVYPNDIILSNIGARLGTAFRAPDLGMPMTLGPNAMLIKAEKLGDYLYCWLQSAYGQKAIKSVVSGAGQPKFNKTQFKKITVPIPKQVSDRNEVVNKINLAESEFKNLYENYKKKLNVLEELKKSILQKAFSGELTQKEAVI